MMIWTYRIFRDQKGRYSIREVFYENDGRLLSFGKQPVIPMGSSLEDLLQLVQWFREAFDAPVLSLDAVEAELATQPVTGKAEQLSAEHSQLIPFEQVLARLAEAPEVDDEQAPQPENV